MNIQEVLQTISERLSVTADVKKVYGDPVTVGDRTVIPVAAVRYAFGGGGGGLSGPAEAHSGGAGGKVSAKPCGALEITPRGTRFVPFANPVTVGVLLALAIAVGTAIVALTRNKPGNGIDTDHG
jgi:uncharacterized spore protein YtfJ